MISLVLALGGSCCCVVLKWFTVFVCRVLIVCSLAVLSCLVFLNSVR